MSSSCGICCSASACAPCPPAHAGPSAVGHLPPTDTTYTCRLSPFSVSPETGSGLIHPRKQTSLDPHILLQQHHLDPYFPSQVNDSKSLELRPPHESVGSYSGPSALALPL